MPYPTRGMGSDKSDVWQIRFADIFVCTFVFIILFCFYFLTLCQIKLLLLLNVCAAIRG